MYCDPLGLFDYNTRMKMSSYTTDDVSVLQKELRRRGFYTGRISGIYDFATRKAVNRYKASKKLGNTGANYGVVGIDTWRSLGLVYRTKSDIAAGITIITKDLKQYKNVTIPLDRALSEITAIAEKKKSSNLKKSVRMACGLFPRLIKKKIGISN